MEVVYKDSLPILSANNRNTNYKSFETQGSLYSEDTSSYERLVTHARPSTKYIGRCSCGCCKKILRYIASHSWCPSWMYISRYIALSFFAVLLWGNMYTMTGDKASPEGQLFKIGVLGVAAYLCGCCISLIGLPHLLGMLLIGVFLRNIGFMELSGGYLKVAADLRKGALVIILLRAGLGLDPHALKRLSGMVFRLAVIPSVAEASAIAVLSHFFLDLPWIWGVLLGAVMAAVSPAVVVPCLFSLQDRGYGRSKGIPTLVIAAASFDDIISISAFGIVLSYIYSTDNMTMTILKGPIGLLGGFVFGILWGLLLWFVPEKNDRFVVILRSILLAGGGALILFGSEALGYDGAGPLGCIVAAFVACHGWRKYGWADEINPVAECFAVLWTIFQPILFGLIGTEVDLHLLDTKTVGLGAACLVGSLSCRIIVSVFVAAGGNLNWKEKFFVAWSWFPKATVQAAIGPVALDFAREEGIIDAEIYAKKVLIVAVLVIIITAPLGAVLINILGPKLLKKEPIFTLEPEPQMSPDLHHYDKKIETHSNVRDLRV